MRSWQRRFKRECSIVIKNYESIKEIRWGHNGLFEKKRCPVEVFDSVDSWDTSGPDGVSCPDIRQLLSSFSPHGIFNQLWQKGDIESHFAERVFWRQRKVEQAPKGNGTNRPKHGPAQSHPIAVHAERGENQVGPLTLSVSKKKVNSTRLYMTQVASFLWYTKNWSQHLKVGRPAKDRLSYLPAVKVS